MKTSKHRQSILIFSLAIPFLVIAILFGSTLYGRSKLTSVYREKETNFRTYQTAMVSVRDLEGMLALEGRKEKIAYWNSKLDQDFIPTLSANIAKILERYDETVLKQNSISQFDGESSIAKGDRGAYTMVSLSFEGGFKPMQMLMAELENEMPQLVLERLAITPVTDGDVASEGSGKLVFDILYLSWKKRPTKSPRA